MCIGQDALRWNAFRDMALVGLERLAYGRNCVLRPGRVESSTWCRRVMVLASRCLRHIAREGERHRRRSLSTWRCSLAGGSAQGLSKPLCRCFRCSTLRLLVTLRILAEIGSAGSPEIPPRAAAVRNDASGEPQREWVAHRTVIPRHRIAVGPLTHVAQTLIGSPCPSLVQAGPGLTAELLDGVRAFWIERAASP